MNAVLLTAGCGGKVPDGALVLTQTPANSITTASAQDILDQRYPPGSRVVIVSPPFGPNNVRVLSQELWAAGGPVVAPNGNQIFFVGKTQTNGTWQIYEAKPNGGRPKAITSLEGGAMDPAVISNGDLVFSSPVPKPGATWKVGESSALYAQAPGGPPQRLTFGSTAAIEPTVLGDGRILFVSARPLSDPAAVPDLALFTVNNDGTEVTAFALDRDGAPLVQRPRELPNGQIGFLAASTDSPVGRVWAEAVRTARPFASRTKLFNFPTSRCRSVEPADGGHLLVCFDSPNAADHSPGGSFAVYRVKTDDTALGQPIFDDPAWNDIEATRVAARKNPMGHISAMAPTKKTGTVLCLDANFSRQGGTNGGPSAKAARVRVLAGGSHGATSSLGEVTLRDDGSFLAEVPADTPLGFESLDADGRVLHRLEPSIWVRPGENRSCLGCHAPYNRSPRNLRPTAAFFPPVPLTEQGKALAQKTSAHAKE